MKRFFLTNLYINELGQQIRLWGFRHVSYFSKDEPFVVGYSPSELHQKILTNQNEMLQEKFYSSFEEANREAKSHDAMRGKDRRAVVEIEVEEKAIKVLSISNDNQKVLLDPAERYKASLEASKKKKWNLFPCLRSKTDSTATELATLTTPSYGAVEIKR